MKRPLRLSDLRGYSRLAVDATVGLADLVETMHHGVTSRPRFGAAPPGPARLRGVSGFVYRAVRRIARLTGGGVDWGLARLPPALAEPSTPETDATSPPERAALLAALNGVLGDHLEANRNPLAIAIELYRDGQLFTPRQATSGKIALLLHGLCMNDRQWRRDGHDHGAELAAELGFTPVYLRYNSGRPIASNGAELAVRLERLLAEWPAPVSELVAVGHSMGGLVMRAACHVADLAGHAWRARLKRIVFLGTPHHGAPLERGGNWLHLALGATSYTAAFARLARLRSAGITDLRHGRCAAPAADQDAVDRFARRGAPPTPVPLPAGVACYAIAATLAPGPRCALRAFPKALAGDGLVTVASALGDHADPARALSIPASRRFVAYGTNHLGLLDRGQVYARIRDWISEPLDSREL